MARITNVVGIVAATVLSLTFTVAETASGESPAGARGRPSGPSAGRLLASGLSSPIGSTIGPDHALYVPEGAAGRITRIDPRTGETSTFASGLPPALVTIGGATIGGAIDVAFKGRTAYVLVTLVGPQVGGDQINGIYRVDDPDSFTIIADLGAFSVANPPQTPFDVASGLQFALEPVRRGFLVTDGHHNRVLQVTLGGDVSELIGFGNTVPTGLAHRGKTVYMGEAGAVPHAPADGKVIAFDLNTLAVREVASGFSLIVDVQFGPGGALYAISQGDSPGNVDPASPALPNSGELLRVNRDGTFTVVVKRLNLPSSISFVGNTAFVVTLTGEVWRIKHVADLHRHHDDDGDDGHGGDDHHGGDHGDGHGWGDRDD